jgi:hypothetical protein
MLSEYRLFSTRPVLPRSGRSAARAARQTELPAVIESRLDGEPLTLHSSDFEVRT